MDPFHFACPHCSSRLRVREKLYVGRQVDCPECGDTLRIVERKGELAVERAQRQPPAVPPAGVREPAGQQGTASKETDGAIGQRGAAASQTAGAASAATPASPSAPPQAQAFVRRIFADRRRAVLTLGAAAALIAVLLAVIFLPRSAGTTGASDDASRQVAADRASAPAASTAGDGQAAHDAPQPAPAPEKPSDEHGALPSNDGEAPLDDSEPGAGGDSPLPLAGDALPGEQGDDDRPIDPDFAPEPPAPTVRKIDLAAALKQPITRFDQPRSKPLEEILVSVAEMAGARITVDRDELGQAAARLAEPRALKLENTTVGDILSGLLNPAGLAYRIEGERLHIIRADD
ncbi:MAG: hypothetical protein ACM3U2_00155 [Deltaproteobacteria bacterium]